MVLLVVGGLLVAVTTAFFAMDWPSASQAFERKLWLLLSMLLVTGAIVLGSTVQRLRKLRVPIEDRGASCSSPATAHDHTNIRDGSPPQLCGTLDMAGDKKRLAFPFRRDTCRSRSRRG